MSTTPATPHPITLHVEDDLKRTRASVFFRLLLAIPHFVWLALWSIAVFFAAFVNWFIVLFRGSTPQGLHGFLADYTRYAVHVGSYVNLLADSYPKFSGDAGYPIDVTIAGPERQNRWKTFFRFVLLLPAALIGSALAGAYGEVHAGVRLGGGLLATVVVLGWFASLALARMPRGMRDAGAYSMLYSAQLTAYVLLLTDRYPSSDPYAVPGLPAADHPVDMSVEGELERSRLTVFFRGLLVIPHFVWLMLWGIAVSFAALIMWFAVLFRGQAPEGLHKFIASWLRYATHVNAFLWLIANPFPGFTGAPGSYPVELVVAPPVRQGRWGVFFRLILALPALLLASAYSTLLTTVAVLMWFVGLFTARVPVGMRDAAALSLRYMQQTYAYLLLLTPTYPYSGPTVTPAIPEPPVELPPDALGATPV